jgi:hypothetical protein
VEEKYLTEDVLQVLEPFSAFVYSFRIDDGPHLNVDVRDHLIDRVSCLRFPNLQHLHIGGGGFDERYVFCLLDLGNRSRQNILAFEMNLYFYPVTLDTLQHELFQRITSLRLVVGELTPVNSVLAVTNPV